MHNNNNNNNNNNTNAYFIISGYVLYIKRDNKPKLYSNMLPKL